MKPSLIVFLINDSVRAIKGVYEEGHTKTVFKTFDDSIKVDDLVVVQTNTRWGMTVVKVTDVDVEVDLENSPEVLWAVQRVGTEAFNVILGQEQKAISAVHAAETARKKEELRASMFKNHEATLATLEIANHSEDPIIE